MNRGYLYVVLLVLACISFLASKAQTTLMVTNTLDNGSAGCLRSVVANTVKGDTIRFLPSLISAGSDTITLLNGAISFRTDNLVFKGLYNSKGDTLYVSGNHASEVFNCSNSTLLSLDSMTIINGALGGGILSRGNVTITNSVISGNSSNQGGGGIFSDSSVTVINSIVSGNNSIAGSPFEGGVGGGGICGAEDVIVTNSTISGNSSNLGGGGIFAFYGATITNSTISGNLITGSFINNGGGGGVYSEYESVTVTNSTISGNMASNSTLGGGIYASPINAISSIIANNLGGDLYNSGSSKINTDGGYNIFTDNPTGVVGTDKTGITASQLNLGALQNNGGATSTMLPDSGSVAIGKGNPNDNTPDQRGYLIPKGTIRDVGAVSTTAVNECTWTGSISTAWENPANWSCGTIPNAIINVYINTGVPNYPIVNSKAICKSLNEAPGTSVKVNTGGFNIVGN